jgi:hypothetical protein
MFLNHVLLYQRLIFALIGGIVWIIATGLTFRAIWHPRRKEQEQQQFRTRRFFTNYLNFMPWILILTYVAIFVYGIVYTIITISNPPNW